MHRQLPTLMRALGVLLLIGSALLPWFEIPETALRGDVLGDIVSGREAPVSIVFKLACVAVALAFLRYRNDSQRRFSVYLRSGSLLLALLLFFPHAVMVWCPATAGQANWLHLQHRSLTWFGGDAFGLQELKDFAWKNRVYAADLLDQTTALNTPSLDPYAVPFGSPSELLNWLGYTNAFCRFVGLGWALALAGCVLLWLGACRGEREADFKAMQRSLAGSALSLAALGVLSLVPALFCAAELDRARSAAERGEASLALSRIDSASWLLPIVRQNSDLALERGMLESRLGKATPEASLYRARVLAAHGLLEQSEGILGRLARADETPGVVRREAVRGLLRRGIRELNSGETARALQSLETVLRADPCNVKANYVLQLAYLRAARYEALRRTAARMRDTYRFFRDETKMPILAAAQENVAYAAYLENDPGAAFAIWKTLSDPKQLGRP